MMKPRGANAWWVAAFLLALLAVGIGWTAGGLASPLTWLAVALGVGAVACAVLAFRGRGRAG